VVDIVSENGLEWTKVSTVTAKRLLFEMAKEGWERYGDDDGDGGSDGTGSTFSEGDSPSGGLELLRFAEDMRRAAHTVRVRYRHPRIRFILPKINEGEVADVDAVIRDLRATGAAVECGGHGAPHGDGEERQPPKILARDAVLSENEAAFSHMMPSSSLPPTSTLNIDCTILLALISDISHLLKASIPAPPPPSHRYHSAITRQIESEVACPLLPTELFPCLCGRTLVCTPEAARRMREIVETMGTPSERTRAEILFGEGSFASASPSSLLEALRQQSAHAVPPNLQLPVHAAPFSADALLDGTRAPLHLHVAHAREAAASLALSDINRSVFFYGWDRGFVTVTSNRSVAWAMEKAIGTLLDEAERGGRGRHEDRLHLGPPMWVVATARSLVGKDKGRREG